MLRLNVEDDRNELDNVRIEAAINAIMVTFVEAGNEGKLQHRARFYQPNIETGAINHVNNRSLISNTLRRVSRIVNPLRFVHTFENPVNIQARALNGIQSFYYVVVFCFAMQVLISLLQKYFCKPNEIDTSNPICSSSTVDITFLLYAFSALIYFGFYIFRYFLNLCRSTYLQFYKKPYTNEFQLMSNEQYVETDLISEKRLNNAVYAFENYFNNRQPGGAQLLLEKLGKISELLSNSLPRNQWEDEVNQLRLLSDLIRDKMEELKQRPRQKSAKTVS